MSQRVCSAYLLPRAWIYGGIPFSAPLGLCTPLLFFKFITFPIIFNNIHWDKCSTKKMEKIGIFKIFFSWSLKGPKLKLQYFSHLMGRADPLEKTEGKRTGWQRMRWSGGITDWMDMNLSSSGRQGSTGKPGVLQSSGSQRVRHNLVASIIDKEFTSYTKL